MKVTKMLAGAVFAAVISTGAAQAVTYDISWTGANGYSLVGELTFSDILIGTGVINETQITDLTINVLLNGVSQGVRSLVTDGLGSFASTFNVNFDTIAGQFVVGGLTTSSSGQAWFTSAGGIICDTVGFGSGNFGQSVCVGGNYVGSSGILTSQSTLTASLAAVPLPATGVLLLGAIGVGAFASRRRKAAA